MFDPPGLLLLLPSLPPLAPAAPLLPRTWSRSRARILSKRPPRFRNLSRTMGLLELVSSVKQRAERFLNEKNVVTDFLGKLEEKTGIKKKIIAGGVRRMHAHKHTHTAAALVSCVIVAMLCDVVV